MLRGNQDSPHGRKRLRTAHACDTCRLRKIRCNGHRPCETCSMTSQSCTYGSDAYPPSKSKSDVILEVVLRTEGYVREMHAKMVSGQSLLGPQMSGESMSPQNQVSVSTTMTDQSRSIQHISFSPISPVVQTSPHNHTQNHNQNHNHNHKHEHNQTDNATISNLHNSTTESILSWTVFDDFPSLRFNDSESNVSFFYLEQSRPHLLSRPSAMYPYASDGDVSVIIAAFQKNVNFWYPTVSLFRIQWVREMTIGGFGGGNGYGQIERGAGREDGECLALLIMALGCTSEVVGGSLDGEMDCMDGMDTSEMYYHSQKRWRAMGETYFDMAMKKLGGAMLEVSVEATQCLFLAAIYFTYLQRPLQAWNFISATATKCRVLLSYPPLEGSADDQECLRRIFWSCYILESDYLAELSALPQTGLADIESSIPLPGDYNTHDNPVEEEHSSLYFLACLSMRRLLNRVHHLLYAKDTGASVHDARFPSIVQELDHQLEEWRECLPAVFQFVADDSPAGNQRAGFLRQRYLTCRSVIYRPYLDWELANWNMGANHSIVKLARHRSMSSGSLGGMVRGMEAGEGCKICLDACTLHILNLRGFAHTIMIDTWICSLSMAGCMLVLLAAVRIPYLRPYIGQEVISLGQHLQSLISRWMRVPSTGGSGGNLVGAGADISPSVERSLRLIMEIDGFIRREYEGDDGRRGS